MKGQLVDIKNRTIYPAEIIINAGRISAINKLEKAPKIYILPGFIDAHIHIESSMLVPSEFAKLAVCHGTVATVSDPHEIANVLGIKGVEFMIDNGNTVPLKFNFGAPSCVPATHFESAGATIDSHGIEQLLGREDILYLAEMMNYPGVLFKDPEVMAKIAVAHRLQKPVDGHAPGLRGEDAKNYIAAGITTDHECFTLEEAEEKLGLGMKILIREGSAAKNFNALIPLLAKHYQNMMFCSDDKHPDDLLLGHIDELVARAVALGNDVFKVLQVACINPVEHYNLDVGLLKVGDKADFITIDNVTDFNVKQTYINGELVAENGKANFTTNPVMLINKFSTEKKTIEDFTIPANGETVKCIQVLDGELITRSIQAKATVEDGFLQANIAEDVLKIVVVNRYNNAKPAAAFIKGFGLKKGAIASCVAHDSHNIVVVGCSDAAICQAVNLVIENTGGIAAVGKGKEESLALPVAGIMSAGDGIVVGKAYEKLDALAKELGSTLHAPFMSLSFMALLVIPSLKLSDKGLFDGEQFKFVALQQ